MVEELNFDIPNSGRKAVQTQSKGLPILMTVVLIAVLINIGIVLMKDDIKKEKPGGAVLSLDQQKKLALKLEKQGLNTASANAWEAYIAGATPAHEDAARIWYRIGKLYQNINEYEKALDGFYRSESFAKPGDISSEVARRIQECLESMGKFAALRYELADRVGMDTKAVEDKPDQKEDPVVAEIGAQKIMKSDLDRMIEHRVDQQISQVAPYLPEDQVNKKKEELLKQFGVNNQRQMFLNQYLLEEVLYRKARETRLVDDVKVQAVLKNMERSLLASKVIEKELAESIKITPGDVETYYEANKQKYVRPERARIAYIRVRDKQKSQDIREKLKNGKDFASLATTLSLDSSTGENGGELSEWVEKNQTGAVPGIGNSEGAMGAIFSTDEGNIIEDDIQTDKGIHIVKVLKREAAAQKTFDEVKNEVLVALRSSKEREVQQKLFSDLKEQYDVVVHYSAFSDKRTEETGASQ